jgi:hypothetical protein
VALKLERLSAKHVEHARRIGYHADGGGLYLQVSPSYSKSWVFRFTLHGRAREMGLGSLKAVSLADARERAREVRKLLQGKRDPIKARDAQRAQEALASARAASAATIEEIIFSFLLSDIVRLPLDSNSRKVGVSRHIGTNGGTLAITDHARGSTASRSS